MGVEEAEVIVLKPILYGKVRNALKVPYVSGYENEVIRERDRRNSQIRLCHRRPLPFQMQSDFRVDFRRTDIKGDNTYIRPDVCVKAGEDFLRAIAPQGPVNHLSNGNGRGDSSGGVIARRRNNAVEGVFFNGLLRISVSKR
jgi:hypothetical protein